MKTKFGQVEFAGIELEWFYEYLISPQCGPRFQPNYSMYYFQILLMAGIVFIIRLEASGSQVERHSVLPGRHLIGWPIIGMLVELYGSSFLIISVSSLNGRGAMSVAPSVNYLF